MRAMRYLISRQWSVLQDFDITGESGDLRYQVRGNLGITQSLTITEPTGHRTAQITRTPFTTWHQVIIDGRQVAEVRHQFLGWNNCTIDSASCCAWSWRSSRSTGSANGAERRPGPRGKSTGGAAARSAIWACVANHGRPRPAIAVITLSSIRTR